MYNTESMWPRLLGEDNDTIKVQMKAISNFLK